MSKKNTKIPFTLEAWEAETLRLTAFPVSSVENVSQNWWREIVGEPPEKEENFPKRLSRRAEGTIEDCKLLLNVEPNRLDWVIEPISIMGIPDDPIPLLLGSFVKNLEKFVGIMDRWFPLAPPMQRLAFGAVLVKLVDSRQDGYRLISSYLPFQLDPEGSFDFSYRINRPRPSGSRTPNFLINRLSKWSVASWKTMGMAIGKDSGKEQSGCRLELDINTEAEYQGTIPADRSSHIFRELIDMGKEIVEKGDIA